MEQDLRISTASSVSEFTGSDNSHDFHGYELLLLRKLENEPELFQLLREKLLTTLKSSDDRNGIDLTTISYNLWFLAVTLDRKRDRFLRFFHDATQVTRSDGLLSQYLYSHNFTELHLDGIYKYGDDNTLPLEIFKCPNVVRLSMKYNYIDMIPPDIGRLSKLEFLSLTNNKLQNKSVPYTLTFCTRLKTLMLDNNLLDALPGFLLAMPSLENVHRHGNHNYFKSTFMWYHTDVNERILAIPGFNEPQSGTPKPLLFWAAQSIVASKINFYADVSVAPLLKDYISHVYKTFDVCGHCNTAKLCSQPGYKVITFKNPYLGNTCVPFQHWACSMACATAIEIPARNEQIKAAHELDRQYELYIQKCERQYQGNRLRRPSDLCSASISSQDSAELSRFRRSRCLSLSCGCCVS